MGGCRAVQPGHGDGGAGLALQAGLHRIHGGQALDVGVAHGGDVVAHHDAGFLGRRAVVYLGHLGVAGLVQTQLHADAQDGAVLHIDQLGVGGSVVVASVLVAGAQQVACGQAVVQRVFVNGVIIVAADVAVHLCDLVVHALFFLDTAHRAVKQTHGHQHGDGKSDRHGKDHDGDRHADGDFTVHVSFLPVRTAAS